MLKKIASVLAALSIAACSGGAKLLQHQPLRLLRRLKKLKLALFTSAQLVTAVGRLRTTMAAKR